MKPSSLGYVGYVGVAFTMLVIAWHYFLANYEYVWRPDGLEVHRIMFWRIPWGRRFIAYDQVREVRRFRGGSDWLQGADAYGRLLSPNGVIVVLGRGVFRRVYLAPPDPEEVIHRLREAP